MTSPTVQPGTPPRKKRGPFAAVAAIIAALALIMPWEGLSLRTYVDIVGVATVCYGQTGKAAAPGAVYTEPQCRAMLGEEVAKFAAELERCVSPDAAISPTQQGVLLSWAYNIGSRAACRSTLVRKINAGAPYTEWCPELLRWDRAGGKRVRGLTNRRQAEFKLCMENP